LTKALRWDIQSLGARLEKAASAEEVSRRKGSKAKSRAAHDVEIRQIVLDIRKLLERIEDAVPLINLAITTSGASLSTTLPASVSPSRLLQASTFLTAGDTQYSMNPANPVQVGPAFILSLYMLFAGHSYRDHDDADSMRDMTWKEAIHKARVKLMRIPLSHQKDTAPILPSVENDGVLSGEGKANEFAYHIEIIEDLDDDRVHDFEDGEPQPGPYGDLRQAGIREFLPIHQISKIFYADTGKILNISNQGETNSPVLLLKRDVYALPPRRMMQDNEKAPEFYDEPEELETAEEAEDDSQDDIDQQLRRESSVHVPEDPTPKESIQGPSPAQKAWRLPPDLDPEWLALEVYVEAEDSSSEDGTQDQDPGDDSAYASHRPSSSADEPREPSDTSLAADLSGLNLEQNSSPSPSARPVTSFTAFSNSLSQSPSPFGPIRSSLSLLEMLIRLTALQQFQQAPHLSIPDELLTFFLEESSTTGAGGDGDERRRTRREARRKVGFDPYDESPVKRHGEEYQYQNQGQEAADGYSRGGTPYDEYEFRGEYPVSSPRWPRERGMTPQRTPDNCLPRNNRETPSDSRRGNQDIPPSSPVSPYRPVRKANRPLDRLQQDRGVKAGSLLGRGMSVETDSTLGTSPGSPTLVNKVDRGEGDMLGAESER
jgi:hypothetical protein